MAENSDINRNFENFYALRAGKKVYPTEFVVRIFLAHYPNLCLEKPKAGTKILDVAFGDGRNTIFLCEQQFEVSGIEITKGIVDQSMSRLNSLGLHADLRVGRNSKIPFHNEEFDIILACACCYYCDDGEEMRDNLREYVRVLRPGGILIASVADSESYIFKGSIKLRDGSYRVSNDVYGNRVGYRLYGFATRQELEAYFSIYFTNFSFGHASNDYFGIDEKLFWVVCQKSQKS